MLVELLYPPVYEVYRGYTVFALSVCLCVCVCSLFSVKNFSGTTLLRILKFCTSFGYDKLHCVLQNQPHIAYQFLYLSIFLSNKFFHHISSASMSARVFKFCIHDEDNQVYY